MDNNIVEFPGLFRGAPPQSIEDIKRNAADIQKNIAKEISERAVVMAVKMMLEMGFNPLSDDKYAKDLMFAAEAIEAAVLKTVNIDHPIQEVSERMMQINDPNEVLESFMECILRD